MHTRDAVERSTRGVFSSARSACTLLGGRPPRKRAGESGHAERARGGPLASDSPLSSAGPKRAFYVFEQSARAERAISKKKLREGRENSLEIQNAQKEHCRTRDHRENVRIARSCFFDFSHHAHASTLSPACGSRREG